MRIGSLFAGIGGFDLAAESLGWTTAWVSEIDPFACAVLAHHLPHAPNLGDITKIDWSHVERPDILCGGFPCQPHSLAGKRGASDDERDLWAECVRAVRDLRPRYAVFENVPGLITSESGRFFGRVLRDLAESGYDAEWQVLSAADVGAPHRRERVWIVASVANAGREQSRDAETNASTPFGGMARIEQSGDRREHRTGACNASVDNAAGAARQEPPRVTPYTVSDAHQRRAGVLPDWFDAIPIRGADGTVRLVPRGAVELGDPSSGRCGGEPRRGTGQEPANGHGELSGRKAEGPRPEPSIRTLADGLPHGLAGRDHRAEEAEPWATPVGQPAGSTAAAFIQRKRNAIAKGSTMGLALSDCHLQSVEFGGTGGSLWPVTESEPGRVAKLRAVGNAIVPKCAVQGPFRRILELEGVI